MSTIKADYTVMEEGRSDLVAGWGRIEHHLADLDRAVAGTHDMTASTLTAYQALKVKWAASATDRQLVLTSLADAVEKARTGYQDIDKSLAAQFG